MKVKVLKKYLIKMLEILNYTAASTYLAWRVTHVSHAWRGTIHENKIVRKS